MKTIYGSYTMFIVAALTLAAQAMIIKEVPVRMTGALEGQQLYVHYCAVCHGIKGNGAGPAAGALKKHPSNLTLLNRMNGGKFPTLAVQLKITGGKGIVAQGTREMPVWGNVFSELGQNRDLGDLRVAALLKYLEQIQAK
jgi:mono/diheme cytochrome c family protein